jgi:HD-GYP domain-containing protein (c-di-GMP phosphodiesterase class II)
MDALTTTAPDSDPALQRLIAESRARLPDRLRNRERTVDLVAAVGFVIVAVAMAVAFEPSRSLDPWLALALVACYALASRVEFAMGSGWAVPTQLFFVPMLFLLPTAAVPLFVAAALLIARLPEYARGAVHLQRTVIRVAEAWYSVWPALVLSATGVTVATFGDWPILLAALAAQFGLDLALTMLRLKASLGLRVRPLLEEMRAIYLVDALLTPIAFLAAVAATETASQYAVLGLLPLLGLLAVFAHEREARIENAVTLSAAYRGTAHLLGELLANSHEYTGSHSRSVVVLVHQVGELLGLDEAAMREVEFGALLHDVGKLAVPVEIINKPSSLTDVEMELMMTHTVEGARMLSRIGGVLGEAGEVVRSHHERYDGRGYPDGLAGAEIPLASRVIACCDAFNAMTTDRPYQAAMTIDKAVAELRANAGSQFDPGVVEAVVEIVTGWDTDVVEPATPLGTAG